MASAPIVDQQARASRTWGSTARFVTAIGIDAIGSGVWMPVSMIFFLATTDLSLVQVGLALSLASLLSLPAAVLVGQQVDRHGSKTVLQAGNALQAAELPAYPFVDQVWSVAVRRRGVGDRADGLLGLVLADGHADLAAGGAGEVVRLPRRAAQRRASRSAGVVAGVGPHGRLDGALLRGRAAERRVVRAVLRAARRRDRVDEPAARPRPRRPGEVVGGVGHRAARPRLPVAGRQQPRLRDDLGRAERRDPRVRRGDARAARLGVGGGVRDQHR